MPDLTVRELFNYLGKELGLEWVAGKQGDSRVISVSELNRPGLSLAGYFEFFRAERIQIFGQGEMAYMQTLDNSRRMDVLSRVFGFKALPCVIVTHNREIGPELSELGNKYNMPVFRSALTTAHLVRELSAYLEKRLAPMVVMHGVFTEVYGLGVLISGDSGTGKSECGLELVKRGHILISDDFVEVRHYPGDILIGSPGPLIKHFMEVRGLGIIDIKQVFGVSAVKDTAKVELVVRLELEKDNAEFDRIGLEDHNTEILGVKIPEIILPLRPGRNVAVLLEVAALNQRLKQEGIFSANELNKKLIQNMAAVSPQNP